VKIKDKNNTFYNIFWGLFISGIVIIILVFLLISVGAFGYMPSFEELENPKNYIASEVYSEDNVLLGNIYYENRSFVNFDELSPDIVKALIATEDIRFTKHSGVDIKGLMRVMVRTILLGERQSGGGSTITQQLSKNLFPRDTARFESKVYKYSKLVLNKFKEWVVSIKLERNYTKEEILVLYLNTVPFGSNSYGIKSAAKTFFNTTPDSLKTEEAAMLIGMLKAPTLYSPVRNPEKAIKRRNTVLSQMYKYKFINYHQYDSLAKLPIKLNYRIQDQNVGLATYLREYLRIIMTKNKPEKSKYLNYQTYQSDSIEWETNALYGWCNKNRKPDGTAYNLYKDGLKIYTTINSRMQKYAEEALEEHLKKNIQPAFYDEQKWNKNAPFDAELTKEQVDAIISSSIKRSDRYIRGRMNGKSYEEIIKEFYKPVQMTVFSWHGEIDTIMKPIDSIRYYKYFFRASLMSVEPNTGYVKAYVGGPNFKYFKYDMVTEGKRQVGSTIKPFLYTLAMQVGYSPCRKVPNAPVTFIVGDSTWTPKNSGRKEDVGKMVTLEWGLANSANYVSAWLMQQFNPQSVVDIIKKMGVKSFIDPVLSIFLGTAEISLYEMVGAYNTFANKGIYITPIFVTRIEDSNGNVLATFIPQVNEVISEETSYLMTRLLQGVVNKGTAARLRSEYKFTNEMGGKTGTTQNHSDGWYIGITPELVTGIWVGAEDRSIHFRTLEYGQGARLALPIWGKYMQRVYNDKFLNLSKKPFDKPKSMPEYINCKDESDKNFRSYDYDEYN
jgi:penicillin-binding protein 1A